MIRDCGDSARRDALELSKMERGEIRGVLVITVILCCFSVNYASHVTPT